MRNLLFPLLGKGPVFGGGGGGGTGGGGGDSDSGGGMSVTASTKSSGGGGYTSIRDMFDGGGPGQSGDTFGGALGGISNAVGASPVGSGGGGGSDNDRSDPAPAAPPPASPPPAAPGTIAGFGQDYNDDGRITIGEVFTDMTDAGGAGGSGGVYSGGPLAGISNVVTGQFNPGIQDMLDGGGPGQSGPQFEGSLVGTAANALGLPPLGQGSGTVSNLLTGVTNATNFATGTPVMSSMMRDEVSPVLEQMGLPQPTTTAAPADQPAAASGPPPVSMGFLPPQMSMVGFNDVMSPTGSDSVVFDDYFMPIPVPQPPAPVPQPPMQMPVSDRFGMPLALSQLAPIRGPDLAQFFAPPAPMYTPAVEPRPVVDPRPVQALPGPTLSDPKGPGGTTGAIPPGGIASLTSATPGVLSPIFGRQA